MKFVRFDAGDGSELGALVGEDIAALTRVSDRLADDMPRLIQAWSQDRAGIERLVSSAPRIEASRAELLAPIERPSKILAIGLNYADHIAETGQPVPEHQIWFCKQPTSANGPFAPIVLPAASSAVDYEAELVAVIGRRAKDVSPQQASDHVFGYCVGNDVTARDWQFRTHQWMLGKSFDSHAPFGPAITTADEVGDPHALAIRCLVNGETRQVSNTKHLVFNVWDQIAHLSAVMTLEPGDLVFTGTPGGVGMAMRPARYLKAGDRVRVEIDKLGAIEGRCVQAGSA